MIVTDDAALGVLVVIENVALFPPAGTTTLAGTAARAGLLDFNSTVVAAGTFADRLTLPTAVAPPLILAGLIPTADSAAACTVSVAERVIPLAVAEMATPTVVATGLVAAVNVALRAPAAIVMPAGTLAAAAFALRRVTDSDAAAGPVRVTVPRLALPPPTDVGLNATALSAAGMTVSVAVFVTVPSLADSVTVAFALTGLLVTVNATLVAPAGTTTVAGTVAPARLLEVSATVAAAVALAVSAIIPVAVAPPVTDTGLTVIEASAIGAGFTVSVADRVMPP